MAETISTLRTILVSRLGLDTTTTAEDTRLSEIVNASVALVLGDSAPSLEEVFVGSVPGDLTVTISSHSAGSSAITLTGTPAQTRRGDIIEDSDGVEYIIRSVASAVVDVGIPIVTDLTGDMTITRRSLLLPDSGNVESVTIGDTGRPLKAGIWGGESNTGTARSYQQMWDAGSSFVLLYPAPDSATARFMVRQQRALAKDAAIDVPNGVIERILATGIALYVAWTSGQYMPIERARKDAADLSGESGGTGVYVR